jgi:hypothetical protein
MNIPNIISLLLETSFSKPLVAMAKEMINAAFADKTPIRTFIDRRTGLSEKLDSSSLFLSSKLL